MVSVDLSDFFPTIGFGRVRGLFRKLGYSPAVATIFAVLCTESPRTPVLFEGKCHYVAVGPRALPQGACISPAISNQIAKKVRLLRSIPHHAKTTGLEAQNRAGIPYFEAHIRGRIAYVHMVDPARAAPLFAALNAVIATP